MSREEQMLYDVMEKPVLMWMKIISRGTNKENIQTLLSPAGISHTFDLPKSVSEKLFSAYHLKNSKQ